MFRSLTLAFVTFVTLFVTTNFAIGAVTAWTAVSVRVYDASGLDERLRQAALDVAGTTLAPTSVEVTWRVCSLSNTHASYCDSALAPGELAIRIVRIPAVADRSGGVRLGDAFIDTHARRGVLATIYLDRVLRLAEQTGADRVALLGHAIAHELGHLLMASNVHGPIGLMRGFWSLEEVRNDKPTDWTIAPRDASAIRRGAEVHHALAGGGDADRGREPVLGVRDPGLAAPGSEFGAR
jgi:hypothetical protein